MVPKTIPSQTMLGKFGRMVSLARTITNPHMPDKVVLFALLFAKWSPRQSFPILCWEKLAKWCSLPGPSQIRIFLIRFFFWLPFFQNGPQVNPFPDHVGKNWKMMILARTITKPHIPDKVFPLASLFSKWCPRPSMPRPCWAWMGKSWSFPGPSQIYIFLIRFFSWLHFFQIAPKTIPSHTMLGKVRKMITLARTITNPHMPDKVFLRASLFPKWPPRQSLGKPCWEKLEKWCPLSKPSILPKIRIRF